MSDDVMVNKNAPVLAVGDIDIVAPPDIVWAVITDFEHWPRWNPDVKAVELRGAVREGTEFRWKSGPGTITSTIRRVERPRVVAWSGKTMGISAVHVWRLQPKDDHTVLSTEESWDGLVVRMFRGRMQKTLEQAIHGVLQHLKAEAERRAR